MEIEIRSATEAVISGYVNAVERDSRILPPQMCAKATRPFVEKVKAGTFRRALNSGKSVELRFNHGKTLGDTSGTLALEEDNIGLHATATVTDPDVIAKAQNGELRGWSFGFTCNKDEWEKDTDCFYLVECENKEMQNFSEVMKLLKKAEVKDDSADFQSDLDMIFDALEHPDNYKTEEAVGNEQFQKLNLIDLANAAKPANQYMCLKYYKDFKKAAGNIK